MRSISSAGVIRGPHIRHEGIRTGRITCTVRIWQRCHVKVGGRYRVGPGQVEVTSIKPIELADVTGELARRSGFAGVVDLLKVARHGPGRDIYLIEFRYREGRSKGQARSQLT
jgi:hypothetical protein